MSKYIVVTGGVVSSIGKGITSASIGRILRSYGLNVTAIKIDPYLNWDSGTLNPYQHGEVFVTEDGMETDLDLGHYERFLDVNLSGKANITTGKVYSSVIEKERRGDYLGSCVQIIPHITDEIKLMIKNIEEDTKADVIMIEVGGTVGDIESQPFIEALRQLRNTEGQENCMFVHVTYVPYLRAAGEFKTKPTQHSTKELRGLGINPDMIVCRSELPLAADIKNKIAHFCDVQPKAVINTPDAHSIYEVPLIMHSANVGDFIINRLHLDVDTKPDLYGWSTIVEDLKIDKPEINIGVIGKYTELEDAYISIREALKHAGAENKVKIEIDWIKADDEFNTDVLKECDGLLIPGGFGERGIQGKLEAVKYAIENKVPIFGICLGLHAMVIELARLNGYPDANSTEFDENCKYPVIDMMEKQKEIKNMGGTMRLGAYPCLIKEKTISYEAFAKKHVLERHRHRYEINNDYRDALEKMGVTIAGVSPDDFLVEIIELEDHPWFVGCQSHPEFKSKPNKAHPLFASFIKAAKEYNKNMDVKKA